MPELIFVCQLGLLMPTFLPLSSSWQAVSRLLPQAEMREWRLKESDHGADIILAYIPGLGITDK